jgi:hypothetical protein
MARKDMTLNLRRENGKKITLEATDRGLVAFIIWKRNDTPALVLALERDEADVLSEMLDIAGLEADKAA